MAQIQIPDFVGHNRERALDQQNAMAMKSNLVTQGLMQNRMGMQNQDMAKEMQDRQELEALLRSTPPEQQERAGLQFLKQRDPERAAKLEAHYLDRFSKRVALDDKGAVEELQRATGERIEIGERYARMTTDAGEVYYDKIKGTWHQVTDAKGLATLQSDLRMKEEKERQKGQMKLETHKAGLAVDKKDMTMTGPEMFLKDPKAYGAMKEIDEKTQARYRAPSAREAGPTPYQSKRLEVDLRKEFNSSPIVKEYDDVRKQMARVESAIEQAKTSKNFVAIDQALVNGINKMIDPGSVVREGEYARTIQNSPLLSRALGKIDQIRTGGGGFTPDERNALVSMMRDFYKDAETTYATHASEYERLAEGGGMDKSRIVIQRDKITPKGGGGTARIVQRNKKTGAVRHSDDGGQTWQPGP